MERWQVD
jgi:hypothetical protein